MKKIILASIAFVSAACGTNSPSVAKLHNETSTSSEAPQFSCFYELPADPYGYGYEIKVYESTAEVHQSSINARFASLTYTIVKDDTLSLPTEEPRFSCSFFEEEPDAYSLEIKVFEDRVIILQSARNARFAPMKYKILKPDSNQ